MRSSRRTPGFGGFLAASLALHAGAWGALAGALGFGSGLPLEEMTIDLTGSFRTRPAGARAPAALPAPTGPVVRPPETEEGPPSADKLADGEDPGDPAAPLHELAALPELKDRAGLRAKLERYYPAAARARGIEGVVTLEVVVSSGGRIARAAIVRSDPPEFGDAALAVCRELEFTPAYLRSRPVAVKIRLPIRFLLER